MQIKSPLKWAGGKYRLAKKIISLFPEHTLYVEVFGGAGHILFRKEPSKVEIYNDINSNLVNFFRVVRDDDKCRTLYKRLDATPYSRAVFDECFNNIKLNVLSNEEKAFCFIVANAQCFGGLMETWGVTLGDNKTSTFTNIKERLLPATERLKSVQLECKDFRYILKRYDRPDTLFYLDPPYTWDSRSSRVCYDDELTENDHRELVDILLNIKGKVILSGYDTPLYEPLVDAGWTKVCLGDMAVTMNKKVGVDRVYKREYVWCKC